MEEERSPSIMPAYDYASVRDHVPSGYRTRMWGGKAVYQYAPRQGGQDQVQQQPPPPKIFPVLQPKPEEEPVWSNVSFDDSARQYTPPQRAAPAARHSGQSSDAMSISASYDESDELPNGSRPPTLPPRTSTPQMGPVPSTSRAARHSGQGSGQSIGTASAHESVNNTGRRYVQPRPECPHFSKPYDTPRHPEGSISREPRRIFATENEKKLYDFLGAQKQLLQSMDLLYHSSLMCHSACTAVAQVMQKYKDRTVSDDALAAWVYFYRVKLDLEARISEPFDARLKITRNVQRF